MNKKQLIAKLSGSLNLSKADAERTFDTITNTMESRFRLVPLKKLNFYQLKHLKKYLINNLSLKLINSLLQKCNKAVTTCINCIPLFPHQH